MLTLRLESPTLPRVQVHQGRYWVYPVVPRQRYRRLDRRWAGRRVGTVGEALIPPRYVFIALWGFRSTWSCLPNR